jgi:hypothetical protein
VHRYSLGRLYQKVVDHLDRLIQEVGLKIAVRQRFFGQK